MRSIVGALVRRAVVTWVLLRLFVLALSAVAIRGDAGDESLFFSFAPIPIVLLLAGILSEVDVSRRHEHALLGNLGLSPTERISIAVGTAAAGELAFALVSAIVRV